MSVVEFCTCSTIKFGGGVCWTTTGSSCSLLILAFCLHCDGHTMAPAKNTLPCGGENNVDDGCGMIFERMPIGNKLCNLCLKLKDFNSKEEADKFQVSYSACIFVVEWHLATHQDSIVQCEVCGLCGSSLRNPCGTCRRLGTIS